jgi:hypothetical protein
VYIIVPEPRGPADGLDVGRVEPVEPGLGVGDDPRIVQRHVGQGQGGRLGRFGRRRHGLSPGVAAADRRQQDRQRTGARETSREDASGSHVFLQARALFLVLGNGAADLLAAGQRLALPLIKWD